MSGTRAGALKVVEKLGTKHFQKMGKKGGQTVHKRPFDDPNKARAAVNKRWQLYREKRALQSNSARVE